MRFFDKDQFREDLEKVFPKDDVEILVQLCDARRCVSPVDEVAKKLGLTTGRVKHRTLKTIDLLRRMAGYAVILERACSSRDSDPEKPKSS